MILPFFENYLLTKTKSSQSPKLLHQKFTWEHKILQLIIQGSRHSEGQSLGSIFQIINPSLKMNPRSSLNITKYPIICKVCQNPYIPYENKNETILDKSIT